MLKFINRVLFLFALQPLNQVLYGGTYKVAHIDSATGKRRVFWCNTWQVAKREALEAHNNTLPTFTAIKVWNVEQGFTGLDLPYIVTL